MHALKIRDELGLVTTLQPLHLSLALYQQAAPQIYLRQSAPANLFHVIRRTIANTKDGSIESFLYRKKLDKFEKSMFILKIKVFFNAKINVILKQFGVSKQIWTDSLD